MIILFLIAYQCHENHYFTQHTSWIMVDLRLGLDERDILGFDQFKVLKICKEKDFPHMKREKIDMLFV